MTGPPDRRVTGDLFEPRSWGPRPISPNSWLNSSRHREFAITYQFALDNLGAVACKAFAGLEPEQVYLVWKTVETAHAAAQRRWVMENYR